MFLHTASCIKNGHVNISIRTADTDVAVLAIHFSEHAKELWLTFGTGKHFCHIPAHAIAAQLTQQKVQALPFFHAFSGCDTTSFFCGKGKTTTWRTWETFPAVTDVFIHLGSGNKPDEDCLGVVEKFVVLIYNKNSFMTDVNRARQRLFSHQSRLIGKLPPQLSCSDPTCSQVILPAWRTQSLPSSSDWRWGEADEGGWEPKWTTLKQAEKSCYELIRCGCKKGCRSLCKYANANLRCTAL